MVRDGSLAGAGRLALERAAQLKQTALRRLDEAVDEMTSMSLKKGV
jgi:hypothetical protein